MTIEELYEEFKNSTGVCTDTRKITKGCLFFALKGGNFNGNEFALKSLSLGAKLAIVDDPTYADTPNCVVVDDGLTALQDLARHHRKQFDIPFLAITGSNGKTTTKELINAVLGSHFKTHATLGNLNNHIGVPLTLLSIEEHTEIAIVEMGANHVGEIADLCRIALPTHGLITNIGRAHLEGFGGVEGIIKGKGELYDYLRETDGTIFVNGRSEQLLTMSKEVTNHCTYLRENSFFNCTLSNASPFVSLLSEDGTQIKTQIIGTYNFENIATALCVGKYFSVPSEKAYKAVEEYYPSNNRSQVVKQGSNTLLLDAYNANPSSMTAALDNFSKMEAGKKVAILGGMKELGTESEKEHRDLLTSASELGFDKVMLCGNEFLPFQNDFQRFLFFEDRSQLVDYLKSENFSDTTVLIKGSRGIGLEGVVEYL